MQRFLLFGLSFLFSLSAFSQDCVNEVELEKLNLKFCLDDRMAVHYFGARSAMIIGDNEREDESLVRLTAGLNPDELTSLELWQQEVVPMIGEDVMAIWEEDSLFLKVGWSTYIHHGKFENGGISMVSSTAILTYESQFYRLENISFGDDTTTGWETIRKIVDRISFFGEPQLTDDSELLASFEGELIEALTDTVKLEALSVTLEKLLLLLPDGDARDDLLRDSAGLSPMFLRWQEASKEFVQQLQLCEDVSIVKTSFNLDHEDEYLVAYTAEVNILCGDQPQTFRMATIAVDDKMYIASIRERGR